MSYISNCDLTNLLTSHAERLVDQWASIEEEAGKQAQMWEDSTIHRESMVDGVKALLQQLADEIRGMA